MELKLGDCSWVSCNTADGEDGRGTELRGIGNTFGCSIEENLEVLLTSCLGKGQRGGDWWVRVVEFTVVEVSISEDLFGRN